MNKDKDDIDEFFRSMLDPYIDNVSTGIWEKIRARLSEEEANLYKKKYLRIKKIVLVLIFFLLSFLVFELTFDKHGSSELSRQRVVQNDKNKAPFIAYSQGAISEKDKKKSPDIVHETNKKHFDVTKIDDIKSPFLKITSNKYATKEKASLKILPRKAAFDLGKTNAAAIIANTAIDQEPTLHLSNDNKLAESYSKNSEKHPTTEDITTVAEGNADLYNPVIENSPGARLNMVLPDSLYPNIVKVNLLNPGKKELFKPYWTLTGFFLDEWSKYHLEDGIQEDMNTPQKDNKNSIDQRENQRPGFTGGFLITYQFSKKLALESGVTLSKTIIDIDPVVIYAQKEAGGKIAYRYNLSSGYAFIKPKLSPAPAVGDSLNISNGQHHLRYLSIPVVLTYSWTTNKFSFSPGVGFSASFLTGATIKTEVNDPVNTEPVNISSLQGIKHWYAGMIFNASVGYRMNNKWGLNLVTFFQQAIIPITKQNIVKTYPYSFGFGLELTHKL